MQHTFYVNLLSFTTITRNFHKLPNYTFYGGNVVCAPVPFFFVTLVAAMVGWFRKFFVLYITIRLSYKSVLVVSSVKRESSQLTRASLTFPSLKTQAQSVGSGEKAKRKFSSTDVTFRDFVCRSAEREVVGWNPGWTNTQGLKITEVNLLPCVLRLIVG